MLVLCTIIITLSVFYAIYIKRIILNICKISGYIDIYMTHCNNGSLYFFWTLTSNERLDNLIRMIMKEKLGKQGLTYLKLWRAMTIDLLKTDGT